MPQRDYVNQDRMKAPSPSLAGFQPGPSYNIQRPRLVLDLKRGLVGVTWKYVTTGPGPGDIRPLETHDVTQDFLMILRAMDATGRRTLQRQGLDG